MALEKLLHNERITPEQRQLLESARHAADSIYNFFLEEQEEQESKQKRKAVILAHGADADGFAAGLNLHLLTDIITTLNPDVQTATEWPMRLQSTGKESYEAIAQRHGNNEGTFYLIADIGGADYDEVSAYFRRGVVMDHHHNHGELSDAFISVNPHDVGLEGSDLSGAGASYLVLDAFLERIKTDAKTLGLTKQVLKEFEHRQQQALITTLAGSSADRITKGMTTHLHTQARAWKLIKPFDIGTFGIARKPLVKVIRESTVHANSRFPLLTKREFLKALRYILKKQSFTPQEEELAQELYNSFGRGYDGEQFTPAIFMQQPKEREFGPHSGLEKKLYLNPMNIQQLHPEEIAEVNTLWEKLTGQQLLTQEGDLVRPDGLEAADFEGFTDDMEDEKVIAALMTSLRRELADLLSERSAEGRGLSCPELSERDFLFHPINNYGEDTRTLIKDWWLRKVAQYADPLQREEMKRLLLDKNYVIQNIPTLPALFSLQTVAELGNLMTALSKLQLRHFFFDLDNVQVGKKIQDAHQVYRTLICRSLVTASFRKTTDERFLTKIQERVYFLDFHFLNKTVKKVLDNASVTTTLSREELQHFDPRTIVGPIAGILSNNRYLSEHYVLLLAGVPDPECQDGYKVSVRLSELGTGIFNVHLGEVLLPLGGGGHPGAASVRLRRSNLQPLLEAFGELTIHDEPYQKLQAAIDQIMHDNEPSLLR